MRIGLIVASALFSAISFSPTPARADDASLTAQGPAGQEDVGYLKPREPR
jgi:hypothetical protein